MPPSAVSNISPTSFSARSSSIKQFKEHIIKCRYCVFLEGEVNYNLITVIM